MPLVPTDTEAQPKPRQKKRTDQTLALANRIDRTLAELPHYGREMILRFLNAKYLVKQDEK